MKCAMSDKALPRGPGRPRAEEPGTTVSTWLKHAEYDQLCKMASQKDTSVSALVRELVIGRVKDPA